MAKQIRQAVGVFASPKAHGLCISSVRVFLYRDDAPRPDEQFWPCNVNHNPASPYHCETFFTPSKIFFEVFTDHCALQGDKPLRFHIHVMGLDLNAFGFTSFRKMGGGGRGVGKEKQKSEIGSQKKTRRGARGRSSQDLITLRALFDALRSFPEGWERSDTPFPEEDEETEHPDVAPTKM